jgi:protein gp37
MNPDWVRDIRDQCIEDSVAFFFKQWGGVNKKKAGRVWTTAPGTTSRHTQGRRLVVV